ncbi:MAG: sugar kinase [bacterium]|nr:sugar kinase [bacterium]
MFDVITFGEAMVRLSPPNFQRLEQTNLLDVQVGGGELNVAVGCVRLGLNTAWVSKLPNNPLGRLIRNKAREHGIDTSYIVWSKEGRAGLYFLEFGATPRASSVLYDRAYSSISLLQPGEIDWKKVLAGTKLFHVSGITPALSKSCAQVTLEALQVAKSLGCKVSYDLNYRSKLWSDKEAQETQEPMMQYVDILITTEEDAQVVFKITPEDKESDIEKFTKVSAESYITVAQKLQKKFGFEVVAITLRETISVWRNTWTAIAYTHGKYYEDTKYEIEIIDRVGSGDAFTAGFIYGYLTENNIGTALKYGNALAALKHSVPGDLNWCTKEEMESLLKGVGLRVKR